MRRRIRTHLTYANVMATGAMFLALGGGAVWAANELGRNDVTAKNLAPKSVGGSELRKDAAKGADVKEASLAEVPSAATAGTASNAGAVDGFDANSLIRTAGASTADAPDANGTALTTTIQAPVRGYLTIFATADFVYGPGPGSDQVECLLEIDEMALSDSSRVTNVSATASVDSDCATNLTLPVVAGSRKVDLEIAQLNDTGVAGAGLSVIFTPFDGAGASG